MDPWKILKYPHMTEKSVGMIESENKIVFVVDRGSDKVSVKKAFESAFDVKVEKVNVEVTMKGEKKAYIKLKPENKAVDVAVKLGIV
ncbi:MAG: 50S ribosomal protein L23 [Lysobacteraceae bacterium]|nr:MAG: 50S ribosomal protein L23 [Xanthomonadaceae bacterium]